MTLQETEQVFHRLAQTDDKNLISLVAAWDPEEYGNLDQISDEYGIVPKLKEYGINPRVQATLKHDQIILLGLQAAASANVRAAANAFVCAIAINDPQRVRWLIPLRAISNILHLPKHQYKDDDGRCVICGEETQATWEPMWASFELGSGDCGEDWEVLKNVMMVRWFNASDPPKPQSVDVALFKKALKFIADADNDLGALKLAKLMKRHFKGLEATWRLFFETLGFAGVLKTDKQPGHLQQWTDQALRARPLARGDARSPMCYWKREFGFNATVFEQLFPDYRLPKSLRAKDA